MSIRHTRRARQEIRQAAQWWQENRRDASDVFERELRRAFYLCWPIRTWASQWHISRTFGAYT
jgi:hypothetical protein